MTEQLPTFPELEPLALHHLPLLQMFAGRFPSYSDFNAVSLWTWSASGAYRVGSLNGNVVVEFRDYLSGESFLSLMGDSQVSETASQLLDVAQATDDICSELRLVPEFTARLLDESFVTNEEPTEKDYLYCPEATVRLSGGAYRRLREQLLRHHRASVAIGGVEIAEVDPRCLGHRSDQYLALVDRWGSGSTQGAKMAKGERLAIERLCDSIEILLRYADIRLCIATKGGNLIGFIVLENLPDKTMVGHFCKCDGQVDGLSARLFLHTAQFAVDHGFTSINMEQDLGIPGLRQHKRLLNPSTYLRKFRVLQAKHE